jgi:hypothetical protein
MSFSSVKVLGSQAVPDRVYYNATIVNNTVKTDQAADDPVIRFADTRQTPLIPDASKYNMSVEYFELNGATKSLPIFIPQIQIGADINTTIYIVSVGIYNGSGFNTIAATIDPSIYYMVSFNLSTTLNSVVYLDAVRLGSPAGTTTIQSGAKSKKFELANTTTDFSGESFDGRILFCLNYSRQLLDSEVTQNFQYFRNRLRKFT